VRVDDFRRVSLQCSQTAWPHHNTIKNWEQGNAWRGAKELLHLAKIYMIDPKEFYGGVPPSRH